MRFGAMRVAISILFIMVGVLMSAWAAIAPYAKARIGAGDSLFGGVILCLGVGSVLAMQLTGAMLYKMREKTIAWVAVLLLIVCMPMLALATCALELALTLFFVGVGLGTLDILMNHQAATVEVKAKRPLMSSFHAWFSVGGFIGALIGGELLDSSLTPLLVIGILLVLVTLPFLWAQKFFEPEVAVPVDSGLSQSSWFVLPKGSVTIAAILCSVIFLAEGAILDWSSVFLVQTGKLTSERASLGYASFAGAMMVFRFTGDAIVKRLGRPLVLQAGSVLASLGLFMVAFGSEAWLALTGFALVGIGSANVVPILFSSISHQRLMTPAAALTAMTTFGYAGMLLGPAIIGWVSEFSGMTHALAFVAVLLICVALLGSRIPLQIEDKSAAAIAVS